MSEKPEVGEMPIACHHGVLWEVSCPACMAFAVDKRNETIATQAAAIEALEEKILAAVKVHDDRAEQVEGFANKTASDMRAALMGATCDE